MKPIWNVKLAGIISIKSLMVFCTVLGALLTGSVAMAHHELIVIPEQHSERYPDRHPDNGDTNTRSHRNTEHRAGRPVEHHREPQLQYSRPYITPYFATGIGSGGDVVGQFTDNYGDTERVRSGGGFYFEGGLLATLDKATMLRLTAGYETDWAGRDNGDASFDRTRFDLTLLRNFGGFELGVGVTAHAGIGYDCNINTVCSDDVEFDSALGYTMEYALTSFNPWNGGRQNRLYPLRTARLGLRYTDIEYAPKFGTIESVNDEILDGKSLALFIGFAL